MLLAFKNDGGIAPPRGAKYAVAQGHAGACPAHQGGEGTSKTGANRDVRANTIGVHPHSAMPHCPMAHTHTCRVTIIDWRTHQAVD